MTTNYDKGSATRTPFCEAFRNSETSDRWTAIPGETLMRRLPAVIEDITEDHDGPDNPHWHHYLGQAAGFLHRVVPLEAEGRHAVVRVSW